MRSRPSRLVLAVLAGVLLLGACGNDSNDKNAGNTTTTAGGSQGTGKNAGKVTLFTAMEPEEATALQSVVDTLITPKVNYKTEIEASSDFEAQAKIRVQGGNPPDIIMYPQPGAVVEQGKAGKAIALEDLGFNISDLEKTFGSYFMSLGEYNGKHYGLPTNINLKSMVWYPKKAFDAKGYKVPTTWDEMIALSDKIKADGGTPWCVGFESGGATGWPATDWMEDIMLRTAGTATYDKWVKHEIPFNDPSVVTAGEDFGKILFTQGYVLGGAKQTTSIAFGDAPGPMFKNPPGCWLHRQATFINAFFPKDAKAGVDYDWFPFPPIKQQGILFGGELSAVFRDAPEVRDFLRRFAGTEVQCAQGKDIATSRVSPNVNVGPECYANSILADASRVLTNSLKNGTGRFDASDLMPSAVGSGSFWTGMVNYVQGGPAALKPALDKIEASWPS
ncbi:MAG TPA: ABC transporter substrate-binding protein [Acidimicrobiales bacterium]|nr:ABC transporter substrate-binding protein [Acidimicrobiales bacterium]